MTKLRFVALCIFLALVFAGGAYFYETNREPSPSIRGTFGGVSLTLEYATTTALRERGLGDRDQIESDYGMLFVFPQDGYYGFWMKDTLIPLDMFWLDSKGQVIYVAKSVATTTYPSVFYPSAPARYVLETSAGFATLHRIATGTPLLLKNWPTVSE